MSKEETGKKASPQEDPREVLIALELLSRNHLYKRSEGRLKSTLEDFTLKLAEALQKRFGDGWRRASLEDFDVFYKGPRSEADDVELPSYDDEIRAQLERLGLDKRTVSYFANGFPKKLFGTLMTEASRPTQRPISSVAAVGAIRGRISPRYIKR